MDFYNHTRKLFANGEVNLANLKVMLVGAGYTFSAGHAVMTVPSGQEVSGNGWTAGGIAITGAAITVTDTNEATLNGGNINVSASGGAIGPASALVVYDATGANAAAWVPLFHFEFPSPQSAGDGTAFRINWHGDGIAVWENP